MKAGVGLWNFPILAFVLEVVILTAGLYLYMHESRSLNRTCRYGMPIFAVVMLLVQSFVFFGPPPTSDKAAALTALGSYALFAGVAAWLEMKRA